MPNIGTNLRNQMSFIGGYPLYSQGNNMSGTPPFLQTTVAAATSGIGKLPPHVAHHPIACADKLFFEEDGTFSCEHYSVPPNDERTKACLIHSIALLIIEEAFKFTGIKELPDDRSSGTKNL